MPKNKCLLRPTSAATNVGMCGIAALLSCGTIPELPPWPVWAGSSTSKTRTTQSPLSTNDVAQALERRGPDSTLHHTISIQGGVGETTIHLLQTVLSHRGSPPETLASDSGDALLFNGELYNVCDNTGANDFTALQQLLSRACREGDGLGMHALGALDELRGPWALIFWHNARRRLYFGRDCLGRRSLMLRVIRGTGLEILSIPPRHALHGFVELPPIGLGYVEFGRHGEVSFGAVERHRSFVMPKRVAQSLEGELVSGSDKGMYVSFLPAKWLRSGKAAEEYKLTLLDSATKFLDRFRDSLQRRLVTNRSFTPGYPRYGVLFSGGIDSLFLAAVLDECLPEGETIELINVAFGKSDDALQACPDRANAISGLAELRNLSRTARDFDLRCVDVGPMEADETLASCVRHLVHPCDQLMDASIGTAIWLASRGRGYSYDARLDLPGQNKQLSCSTARILFSGLGADELMGGYKGRHRTIFRSEGAEGVKREMDADLSRLWFRNLGRDDRLIADHGKEVRHPFLDEDLISLVTRLPLVEHVCDLSKPDGVGDKHLLRRAAALVGLSSEATRRAKRAIQFGSRCKQVIERKRGDGK